jgi:6-phosphogluconolactonase (cycloisomerase 2 family)
MQSAACWLIVTDDGRFAYTANAGSGSITGYGIAFDGSLSRLDANGVTAVTGAGSHPTDLVTSGNGRFLFQLSAGANRIDAFRVGTDGSLTPRPRSPAFPRRLPVWSRGDGVRQARTR